MAWRIGRGDVVLVRFPKPDKERPVAVITRTRSLEALAKVTVAPITSTVRGVASEVILEESDGMKGPCAINLHNLVTIDKRYLGKRVAQLTPARMEQVCRALAFALGCD